MADRGRGRGRVKSEAMAGRVSRGGSSNGGGSSRGAEGDGGRGAGRGSWRPRQRDPVTRPEHVTDKRGQFGATASLVANYFKIKSTPNWTIYQYHVDFSPDVENTRRRRGLVHIHKEELGTYNFDGALLFKMERFDEDEMDFISELKGTEEKISIHLRLVREVAPKDPIVMQIMDIQMRRNMRTMQFQQLNRLYYDQHAAVSIPNHNLELWPGFNTAIHQYEESAMLCADLCFKFLRSDSVLDQLMTFLRNVGHGQYRDLAGKELLGCIILTRYNNSTYRIDDIAWDKKPTDTFAKGDTEMSFIDYYQSHWNITIHDHQQPLLISMPKKRDVQRGRGNPILLIPELCTMTGISEETRNNFNTMRDLGQHTRVAPEERGSQLRGFVGRMIDNKTVNDEMSRWGLAFDRELVQFQGRVFPPEAICLVGNDKISYDAASADWSKELRNNRLLRTINLKCFLLMATRNNMQMAMNFVDTLRRVCGPIGIEVDQPQRIELGSDRATEYSRALSQNIKSGVQLAICFVPNNSKDRYDAIKKTCCIECPVASQVIVAKTLSRQHMVMSIATKIGIQLNCKLGGAPWGVQIPTSNLMIIGYDCYRDSSQRGRAVGALCCSFNRNITQYYSKVCFQTSREDMMSGLKKNLIASIKYYLKANSGTVPDRIFFYRDGVSEGQLGDVKDEEVKHIQECFKEISPNFKPRLTFIVVNKRINTRIFQRNGRFLSNPTPGTIVDSTITKPEFYDFFIVSQSVRQGTVTPTQYNIIHDESGMKPDHIQRITYKLTHLYYNWPGTIRVPAPCLYAHKLAFLTGQFLHAEPSEKLADTLFYL